MNKILDRINEKRLEFIRLNDKDPKYLYLSTSVAFELDSELSLTQQNSVDKIQGMEVKFVPGVSVKEILEVSDEEIR